MHLALILAVLAALLTAESSPTEPVAGVVGRLLAAGAAMAGVCLFAAAAAGLTARGIATRRPNARRLLRRFDRMRRLHVMLWLAAAGGISMGLDWAQLVRVNWGLAGAFLLDDLLILAPVIVPLVLSWAAFYEVDRAVQLAVAPDAAAAEIPSRRRYIELHARHYLGIVLVPVLAMLAVGDAATLLAPGLVEQGKAGLVLVPALILVMLLFPSALRHVWTTEPLPSGPLRERLEQTAAQCRLRARSILVWQTEGMVANAAVAGFLAPLRHVFLSDGLIELLDTDELAAVFAHEAGHVRHRHLLLRILAMLLPFSLWLSAEQLFPQSTEWLVNWLEGASWTAGMPMALALLAAAGAYVVFIFGRFSRLLEYQADLFACRQWEPPADRSAVEVYASALRKLAEQSGSQPKRRTWQHPSVHERIAVLRLLATNPSARRRFERRVRWTALLLTCLVVSPALLAMLPLGA